MSPQLSTTPGRPKRRASLDPHHTPIAAIMTREVVSVPPEMSVDSLVELMLDRGVSRVPVVDERGKPVGIVTKTDVVSDQHTRGDTAEQDSVQLPGRRGVRYSPGPGFHLHEISGTTAADVMCRKVLTLPESAPISKAAEVMALHHVQGVPVISPTGKVVGLLSALDIIGWVAGLGESQQH